MADKPAERSFEEFPLTRAEYISAVVHLYRGEQHRAQIWRTRLDTTTNWAVLSIGAILSYAFTEERPVVLVLGMYMIFTMLVLESRRFRFYDVWRNRVRRIEENFYVPILRRDLTSPMENWGFYVAEDLLNPSYKITFLMAMKARLVNNYVPLFVVLLASWLVGLYGFERRHIVPDSVMLASVVVLYAFILYVLFVVKRSLKPEEVYFGTRESIDDVG